MPTFLFHDILYGPVRSRRLGLSLGVNLLPTQSKLCNFNCIYCECGWNGRGGEKPRFNRREDVKRLLGDKLHEMAGAGTPPDVITFAGNGEPTMHPEFEQIIDDTLEMRDRYCPSAKVSVLSNATMIGRESVRRALERVDNNILKLDSAFDATVRLIDNPPAGYTVAETVRLMKLFEGRMILQTMFLRGERDGQVIDNTTDTEVEAWLERVKEIAPCEVMVYTLDRDTPLQTLVKVPVEELKAIAAKVEALGIPCKVAG